MAITTEVCTTDSFEGTSLIYQDGMLLLDGELLTTQVQLDPPGQDSFTSTHSIDIDIPCDTVVARARTTRDIRENSVSTRTRFFDEKGELIATLSLRIETTKDPMPGEKTELAWVAGDHLIVGITCVIDH